MVFLELTEKLARKVPRSFDFFQNYLIEYPINYSLNNKYEKYVDGIKKLKDIHKGERCFLIGTGPSLNKTDFSLIQDEVLFGVNRLYEGFDRFNIRCRYMALGDEQLFDDIYRHFLSLDSHLFICSKAGRHFLKKEGYYKSFIKSDFDVIRSLGHLQPGYSLDISKGIGGSATIITESLQIIMYMGFKEVYLLGCDCDYSGVHQFHGGKNKHVEKDEKVDSYVSSMKPIYQMFDAYKIIKKQFENNNRHIYNSTVGGKLEVFERKSLEEII